MSTQMLRADGGEGIMTRLLLVGICVFLQAQTAIAQQVSFKCSLQNDSQGWKITGSNPTAGLRKCKASCEVTKADGTILRSAACGPKEIAKGANDVHFCGEIFVQGSPLKSPKITTFSCD